MNYSLDGHRFAPYTGPVVLLANTGPGAPTISAFADDTAGNRSPVTSYTPDTSADEPSLYLPLLRR